MPRQRRERAVPASRPGETKVAAIYLRVSTKKQAQEGHSLEQQEERARRCAQQLGLDPLPHVYLDVERGKKVDRSGYQRLKADRGRYAAVICFKLDRMGRKASEVLTFLDELGISACPAIASARGS